MSRICPDCGESHDVSELSEQQVILRARALIQAFASETQGEAEFIVLAKPIGGHYWFVGAQHPAPTVVRMLRDAAEELDRGVEPLPDPGQA